VLGDGPQRLGIEKIVHHDDIVDRVAEHAVGDHRGRARRDPHAAHRRTAHHGAQEAQSLVAGDEGVAREDQRIVLIEEFDANRTGRLDVDEDQTEGAGVAAVEVPGRKKVTSVMLLLTAVKSFCGLKVWSSFAKPNPPYRTMPAYSNARARVNARLPSSQNRACPAQWKKRYSTTDTSHASKARLPAIYCKWARHYAEEGGLIS
jgi:hypothetical protein